jgi:MFS family permease
MLVSVAEIHQFGPCCLPCHDVYFHRRSHSISIYTYRCRPRRYPPASKLPHVSFHCNSRRRPVVLEATLGPLRTTTNFLLSLICSIVGNIGCTKSPSYASMAVCRVITAFFISPAAAIGPAVVVESFFKKDRARYMGIWALMVTLGVPLASFIFVFVANDVGYRWIYWILAMV